MAASPGRELGWCPAGAHLASRRDAARPNRAARTMNANDTFPWPVHPAAELFPLLGADELRELADDVKAHGLHEAVWLYRDPERGVMLLDGRNRWRACEAAGAECRTRYYNGTDPIAFSLSLNMKRRHLTLGQKAFAGIEVARLYEAEADRGGRPRKGEEKLPADLPEVSTDEYLHNARWEARQRESRERAAKAVGASGRAIGQAKRVEREAPDLAEKVRAGGLAIDRAERIIRDREAERRRIEQARAEAAAQPVPTIVDIRVGDFREALADVRDIDAVITDPPYPYEFLPLLADLAAWADKVLTPDGVLAVLMGQTYLPEVYRLLDGHRPYRWTGCYLTGGQGYVSHPRRVQSNWKPVLIYGGGARFMDLVTSEGAIADAKNHHKWGQDYGAFHTIVERLTARGQTVADPFMGSGTTLLAAHALGRHAIGADTDPAAVATARERLA